MSGYMIRGETLTAIADAIRAKDGTTDAIKASDMAARIEGIQSGGGDAEAVLSGVIAGTLKELTIPEGTTEIGTYAFYKNTVITTVNMPETMTKIGTYAFSGATAVVNINIPDSVTWIGMDAFRGAAKAKITTLPPTLTVLGNYAFNGCKEATFGGSLPQGLSTISQYVFQNCAKITLSEIPEGVTSIGMYAFAGCYAIREMYCPTTLTKINSRAFYNCLQCRAVVIRNTTSVVTLGGTDVFKDTYITSGIGYVYVPAALIEDYKVATNWSAHANQFRALEDYTVDGTVTGKLDASKI